jgi:hypothetical protein
MGAFLEGLGVICGGGESSTSIRWGTLVAGTEEETFGILMETYLQVHLPFCVTFFPHSAFFTWQRPQALSTLPEQYPFPLCTQLLHILSPVQ